MIYDEYDFKLSLDNCDDLKRLGMPQRIFPQYRFEFNTRTDKWKAAFLLLNATHSLVPETLWIRQPHLFEALSWLNLLYDISVEISILNDMLNFTWSAKGKKRKTYKDHNEVVKTIIEYIDAN